MKHHRRRGFTMLELVVALTITSVVLAAISATVVGAQREFARQRSAGKAEETVRAVESLVTRVLRNGRADPKGTGNGKINLDPLGRGSWDNIRIRSDFNPTDGDFADPLEDVLLSQMGDTVFVRWTAGGATERFAYPVTLFEVEAYKLDGTIVLDTAQAGAVQKIKLKLKVPRGSDDVIWRERWIILRN